MRHLEDSYIAEWTATVTDVAEGAVVLSETYFYPVSGGQPADTGIIVSRENPDVKFNVVDVRKGEGVIVHGIEGVGEGVLVPGDVVLCSIDWPRRHRLMRSHTAAHIVSEIIHRQTGAMITGNQLDTEKVRIDFSLDVFDPAAFVACIDEANGVVARGLPVTCELLSREAAMRIPTVSKLAGGLPAHILEVRIVTIEGFDQQACGGTHVKSTAEIGRISFLKAENKGKQNRRVYFSLDVLQ